MELEKSSASPTELPESIAIAGAWGYIGRKFLDAAISLGIKPFVFDPGDQPGDIDPTSIHQIDHSETFYNLPVDFYHLAMHPEDRMTALSRLLNRPSGIPALILNEKPMSTPERPAACRELVSQIERSGACMLFDFPELFDDLTVRICRFLGAFRHVQVREVYLTRSKDREAPEIARNYKRMVPIQYQESVHCLAYVLFLLGFLKQSLPPIFDRGVTVRASSERYAPPNPEAYAYPVDGKCEYQMTLGDVLVRGITNFKRNACWSKERVIRGLADGQPFSLEVDYLEGRKRLAINGVEQPCDAKMDSYQQVIQTAYGWQRKMSLTELMGGIFPHPVFAWTAYQLSSVLWRSAQDQRPIQLASWKELLAFDAFFARRTFG